MELLELLSENPIFSSLGSQDREVLGKLAITQKYKKGEWITHNGDLWPFLFWVEKGKVIALKESGEGRSLIANTINAREIFWGLAFFEEGEPMPVALVAEQDSQICMWSRDELLPFLFENGKMSWELSRQMILRMQQASDVVESLAFQPVQGRLASLLLNRYSGNGENTPVARDMTLDQMASHIGSTREMVCRVLYKFADQGVIKIDRTEFLISDKNMLENIAHRD